MAADHLTATLPGTGGILKSTADDFIVSEIPLYLPCGEGEHLYVEIEKRGLTTLDAIDRLARALKLPPREIGYAGLKDARAVTRQTLSLPATAQAHLAGVEIHGLTILAARRHRNKLRLGHLAGNRFSVRLRQVADDAVDRAEAILAVLAEHGVPNRFGSQRYGVLGNSHLVGGALLRRDYEQTVRQIVGDPGMIRDPQWQAAATAFVAGDCAGAWQLMPGHCRNERQLLRNLAQGRPVADAVLALPRPLLRLYLSAWQSHLFDRMVTLRLSSLGTLREGDLAYKHVNGACFTVVDVAVEQPRADSFEVSPSAPLFGAKVTLAGGESGLLEQALLDGEGLSREQFRLGGGLDLDGERRPLRVPLREVRVAREDEALLLDFILPKGSYATSVLREVMKLPAIDSTRPSVALP